MSEPTKLLTGTLVDWYTDPMGRDILWGWIEGDAKGRFDHTTRVHTSSIPDFRTDYVEGDVIETMNSVYLLGKPYAKQ